jgi:hypothetical protein
VRLEAGGGARLTFRVRGRLAEGTHSITAVAESEGRRFTEGYVTVEYDHIRRRRIALPSTTKISAVDVRLPPALRVAYVPGVGDNVAPMLEQLGVPVSVLTPAELSGDGRLSGFSTVVIGPRAYEASPELAQANDRLFEFARRGGTVVVQYGQYEMARPGMMPYPITLGWPHDRVTEEDAPVRMLDAGAPELRSPNRLTGQDFAGWVQERGLYMPRSFDERYRPLVETNDTGYPPNRGGVLVAPLGDGVYVYTTLSFFRQLPAGVPGAARLFVNLLSAGRAPAGSVP